MTKCPYNDCNYEYGYDLAQDQTVGDERFYEISNGIIMQQDDGSGYVNKEKSLIGCPKCNRLFMKDE
jgi:hypothetical protein